MNSSADCDPPDMSLTKCRPMFLEADANSLGAACDAHELDDVEHRQQGVKKLLDLGGELDVRDVWAVVSLQSAGS
jgi:hypothetical protein